MVGLGMKLFLVIWRKMPCAMRRIWPPSMIEDTDLNPNSLPYIWLPQLYWHRILQLCIMSSPLENTPENLERIEQIIRNGGVVLYPTETVYGLGCDPYNESSIEKVRGMKGRPKGSPMLAVTPDWAFVTDWFNSVPDTYRTLMKHEPPLSVTLIFEASEQAPPGLVSKGTIAVRRIPESSIVGQIASRIGGALLSTSANLTGHCAPSSLEDVDRAILDSVDYVVESQIELSGVPSTVIRDNKGILEILRHGCADAVDLQRIIIEEYEKADN